MPGTATYRKLRSLSPVSCGLSARTDAAAASNATRATTKRRPGLTLSGMVRIIPSSRACGSPFSCLELVEQLTDACQVAARGLARGERVQHELAGRPSERPVDQVAHQLLLRRRFRGHRHVDVRPLAFVALHQALVGHDL